MAAPGRLNGLWYGPDQTIMSVGANQGITTFSMGAATNTGWCARFMALDTRDVSSVYINWSTVTSAVNVQLRIETIDATTGKPTGTLYDANAVKTFTPVAGWQQVTFDTLPTTGLTAGTEYGVVLLTTGTPSGTTMTLRSSASANALGAAYPTAVLTAADGSTRSNFGEVANAVPILSLVMEDSVEEIMEFCVTPTVTSYNIFSNTVAALKFTVPTGLTLSVMGFAGAFARIGTPAGDLRGRIFDNSNNVISGTTITMDKDSLSAGASGRRIRRTFAAPVSLSAGTYRLVFDSASSANSSNCWRLVVPGARVSSNAPSGFSASSATDGGSVWTDTATDITPAGLVLDNLPDVSSGGVSGARIFTGM